MKFVERKIWHGRIYWNPRISLTIGFTFLRVYDTSRVVENASVGLRFTVPCAVYPGNLLPILWHKIFSLAGKIIFGHQSLLESEDFFDDGHDLLARVRHVALVENASVDLRFTPFQF